MSQGDGAVRESDDQRAESAKSQKKSEEAIVVREGSVTQSEESVSNSEEISPEGEGVQKEPVPQGEGLTAKSDTTQKPNQPKIVILNPKEKLEEVDRKNLPALGPKEANKDQL